MLHKMKQQKQEGFTIIEVLIVLAIAGLIMMVVFLAVPNLQRNSRNTQRKSDVSAIVGGMSEYVNNNAGQLPTTCTAGSCTSQTWLQNAKLSQYDPSSIAFSNVTTARTSAPTAATTADQVLIYNYAKCNGMTITNTNATARSIAASYMVETSSAAQAQCTEM